MSKFFRRRLLFAPLRDVAFVSLLSAALVGSVGCAGGSNPFCCDSKEKDQIDNLERAQSVDEDEKDSEPTENSDEKQESAKKTLIAASPLTDGSGDAPQLVDASTSTFQSLTREPQEVPVTASTSAAAQDPFASTVDLPEPQTSALLAPTPAPEETQAAASPDEAASLTESETPTAPATTDAEKTANESQEAQNKEKAQEETPSEEPQEQEETQEEKTPETPETPVNVSRSSRRDGPQRAATRQVAQRAANQTVAVPQTRAAETLPAPSSVVVFRTRAVVPAVSTPVAPTPSVTFRTRVVVP